MRSVPAARQRGGRKVYTSHGVNHCNLDMDANAPAVSTLIVPPVPLDPPWRNFYLLFSFVAGRDGAGCGRRNVALA